MDHATFTSTYRDVANPADDLPRRGCNPRATRHASDGISPFHSLCIAIVATSIGRIRQSMPFLMMACEPGTGLWQVVTAMIS